MLRADSDTECMKVLALVILNLCGIVIAQFDNYYNWPDTSPPVVKTETRVAGKETRLRCHIKERFRHIQNGLNLTWEHKNTSLNRSAFAGQPPMTDQRPIANGGSHGRNKMAKKTNFKQGIVKKNAKQN
ncbi:hypothetical protein J6590_034891 [Homalodisca vitripennis]|nr:hypothetical protein J6590_034891 [Homalodisca vitripennis]